MVNESNPFKDYTNHLAVTLENKNKDYGDSFSRSVDKFGIIAAVVRLEDKFNRLENLTANGGKEMAKKLPKIKRMDGAHYVGIKLKDEPLHFDWN